MGDAQIAMPSARDRALAHCEIYIAWYDRVKTTSRRLDHVFQTATISLSAITPLLILISDLPAVLKALPATLAGIAAGLQGVFKFRERYLGFALAGELLKAEKLRFEVRAEALVPGNPDSAKAVEQFVKRVNRIVLAETEEWRRHWTLAG